MSTPIARWDVVPYQRITDGFTAGIVAFHKDGIDDIVFTISGAGFSGTSPQTVSAMALNDRTGVWEYFITLNESDFASDGNFTIDATVTGNDTDTRTMPTMTLRVDSSGTLMQHEAWVNPATGNNGTAAVNNESAPYADIGTALTALATAGSGSADGAILYLTEGTYNVGTNAASFTTTNEWVTIKPATGAARENVIINAGTFPATALAKFQGVTFASTGSSSFRFYTTPTTLWLDDCIINGAGQHTILSNPVYRTADNYYSTGCTISNVDYGMHYGLLARNITINDCGNDAFANVKAIFNATVDGCDPGTTYWHADVYQCHTTPADNRIIFNLFAQNCHYQGIFLRGNGQHQDCAFVNMFIEMRQPGRQGSEGGETVFSNGDLYGLWDHVLFWHCTIATAETSFDIYSEPTYGFSITNSSFIGNVFRQYIDSVTQINSYQNPDYTLNGNTEGNTFLHNHYYASAVYTGSGGATEPHWYSKNPDSGATQTYSIGDHGINLTPGTADFGYPQTGAAVIDRISPPVVPVDVFNTERGSTADLGAIEHAAASGYRYPRYTYGAAS